MKNILRRIAAILMTAAMLASSMPAVFAETEAVSAPVDPIAEEAEFSLEEVLELSEEAPVLLSESAPFVYLAPDSAAPGGEAMPPNGSEDTPSDVILDEPEPIEGYANLAVSKALNIGSDTLSKVNILRVGGYDGTLARVTGKLTLNDVLIEGQPASKADLAHEFELVTGASVVLSSNGKLRPSVNALSIDKGAGKTLKLKYSGKSIKGEQAKWKTSNKKIVTVSKTGKIKGVSKGVATITATYKKKKASIRVVVTNPVTKVTLSPSVKYLDELTQQQFTAAALPETADYPALTWATSNEEVAQVDASGLVSCLKPGKATITVSAVNGKKASVNLTVIRPALDMTLPETLTVNSGKTHTLKPAFIPEDTSLKTCTWTTSDKKVATVSSKGVVKGVGAGTCTITAASHNGIVRECVVTVIVPVKSIKMSASKKTISLNTTSAMSVKFSPSKPSDKTLIWSSSDPSVASVDENGNVTALKKGKVTIKAVSHNGKTAKCSVTVKEYKPKSLNFSHLYVTMNPGAVFESQPKIQPANVSNPTVLYTSSNPAVAAVDEMGVITAVGVGKATITGKCAAKTSISNTFEVCVIEPGSGRMAGLTIGINPGHQTKTITKKYPIAPGSKEKGYGCKVGAVGKWTRIPEYKIVLDVGLKLADMLTAEGATVVLTRTTNNVSLTNIQRAKMLNEANVDVAIQLHCNSSTKSSKNGLSAFYRTTGSWVAESKALAKALCKDMSAATGLKNKGIEAYNGYMSLNYSTTPAVLLEMGYLSNKTEDKLLSTDEFREKLAIGIYEGLCRYFGR
ncbi:MAG: Ig-like domain-containing protein [Clostridia bacterium]|nr:Ig-like domain-containing protein [Clostridia bacterium]